jgi:hypothetical protein
MINKNGDQNGKPEKCDIRYQISPTIKESQNVRPRKVFTVSLSGSYD